MADEGSDDRLPVLEFNIGLLPVSAIASQAGAKIHPYSEVFKALTSVPYSEATADGPVQRPDLALALIGLGTQYSEAERPDEAILVARESIDIYRELVQAGAERYMPNLALALMILDSQLARIGQDESALAAVQEAVQLYRALAESSPQPYRQILAMCLGVLSVRQQKIDDITAALKSSREAMHISCGPLITELAGSEADFTVIPGSRGAPVTGSASAHDREVAVEDRVRLLRTLVAVNPADYRPSLADALIELANVMSGTAKYNSAHQVQHEAVAIFQKLTAVDPARFRRKYIQTLKAEAEILRTLGRETEAAESERLADALPLDPYL